MSKRIKTTGPKAKIATDHPLFDVIEKAYQVFACAPPVSAHVFCCEFCFPPDQERALLNGNQRDIPYHLLRDWYFAGVVPDVPKSFSSRFSVGDRSHWSDKEWAVIEEFRVEFLDNLPKPDGLETSFEDAMVMFVLAGWDAQVLFDQFWQRDTETIVLLLRLHWSMRQHDGTIKRRPWISSWWPDEKLARSFFLSSRLYDRLVSYGTDTNTPEPLAKKSLGVADSIYQELGGVEGIKADV